MVQGRGSRSEKGSGWGLYVREGAVARLGRGARRHAEGDPGGRGARHAEGHARPRVGEIEQRGAPAERARFSN